MARRTFQRVVRSVERIIENAEFTLSVEFFARLRCEYRLSSISFCEVNRGEKMIICVFCDSAFLTQPQRLVSLPLANLDMSAANWTPESWRQHPITQAVEYPVCATSTESPAPDPAAWRRKKGLEEVKQKLRSLPPLVSAVEVRFSVRPRESNLARSTTISSLRLNG